MCTCGSLTHAFCYPIFTPNQQILPYPLPEKAQPVTLVGWECPRCTRVYGPNALECDYCNNQVGYFNPTKITIK
jgi:hypothetical protein